jgi:ABC-type Fe3+-siderophore transport system permease subunit
MNKNYHYRTLFWYEALLAVLLSVFYDTGRTFFGVYAWIVIVLALLIGVPALLLLCWRAADRS